jgi:hypothetical protein
VQSDFASNPPAKVQSLVYYSEVIWDYCYFGRLKTKHFRQVNYSPKGQKSKSLRASKE